MSHVASVEAYCTNLDALEMVADKLGFDLVRGATEYKWFGRWMADYEGGVAAVTRGHKPENFGKCQHKLKLKDAGYSDYEIGLVPRLDGQPGWELLYDNWSTYGAALEAKAGKDLVKLKDALNEEVTRRQLAREGYRLQRLVHGDGTVELVATK